MITVHLKRGAFFPSIVEALPCSVCFTTCMAAHFPAVGLYNAVWFNVLSRVSGFLWHNSKWAHQFGCFHQYMLGLEVLACSFDTNFNYVITILQLHPSVNHKVRLLQCLQHLKEKFSLYWSIDHCDTNPGR